MIKIIITSIVLLFHTSNSYAKVQIEINGVAYSYQNNPRLDEVLSPVVNQNNWYWPSAKLFKTDNAAIEAQRIALIKLLSSYGEKQRKEQQAIIDQIKNWHLADRVKIKIDFDLARFSLTNNPKFEDGSFVLTLSKRPNFLTLFGALPKPGTLPFPENKCVRDLLAHVDKLPNADHDHVYVISPNGNIDKVPIAYWNQLCFVPMPGSMVYVPLRENQWFTEATDINQQVAELAINRTDEQ